MNQLNDKGLMGGTIGTAISGGAIALSVDDISRWISIACTIIGLLITIITSIVIPLCQKKAPSADQLNALKDETEKVKKELEDKSDNG